MNKITCHPQLFFFFFKELNVRSQLAAHLKTTPVVEVQKVTTHLSLHI